MPEYQTLVHPFGAYHRRRGAWASSLQFMKGQRVVWGRRTRTRTCSTRRSMSDGGGALIALLVTTAPPKDRDEYVARLRERSAERYGRVSQS